MPEPLQTVSRTKSRLSVPCKRGQTPHASGKSCHARQRNRGSAPPLEPTAFATRLVSKPARACSFIKRPFCPGLEGHSVLSSYSSWMRTWRSPLTPESCTSLVAIAAHVLPAAPLPRLSRHAEGRPYLSPPRSGTARDIDVGFPCHVLANGA